MFTNRFDLQALALKMVFDRFAECDYFVGEKIVSDVMVLWCSRIVRVSPVYISDSDKPIFPEGASEKKQLGEVIIRWSKRYWGYFEQIKNEDAQRFTEPTLQLENPDVVKQSRVRKSEILKLIENLSIDEGIEIMAILTVEWARRFNTKSFLQFVQQNNPTHLDGLNNDTDIIVEALNYMDINFQLA